MDKIKVESYRNGLEGDMNEWLLHLTLLLCHMSFCKNIFTNCISFSMCLPQCVDHGTCISILVAITISKPHPHLQWFMFWKCSSISKYIFVKFSYVLKIIALLLILWMLFSTTSHYFSTPRVKDSILLLNALWLLACSVLGNMLHSGANMGEAGTKGCKRAMNLI